MTVLLNAIVAPSGDHDGSSTNDGSVVRTRTVASDPSASMTQRPSLETNVIRVPSGDQSGLSCGDGTLSASMTGNAEVDPSSLTKAIVVAEVS